MAAPPVTIGGGGDATISPPPPPRTPWTWGRVLRTLLGIELIVLLALAQVLFAGYRVGVGNQSIQIAFLRHWIDPQMYAVDPMVRQTIGDYHSYFFKGLAAAVGGRDIYAAYFWLHVATAAAVLGVAYLLGRAIFNSRATGAVLVLLLLAGHHRALAGDDLYSVGFTHTWAVFPLALFSIYLLYRDRPWLAFAVAGLIFNLHALTAGYLLVMFLAWAVIDYRPRGWRWKLPLLVALFLVLAIPTLSEMVRHRQHFGADWLEKTRIRSADHSFPSSWWTAGDGAVPRFALLAGLFAVSLSFAAAAAADRRNQRKTLLLTAGAGTLFAIGWVFSEVWPIPTVVRAQLFRSSRLLAVLMLAHVAHGIVGGWRLANLRRWLATRRRPAGAWHGSSAEPFPGDPRAVAADPAPSVGPVGRTLEAILATATFVCLAVPGLFALAPWVLAAAAVVALFNARLAWTHAAAASLALLLTVAAWRSIEFHIPGIDGEVSLAAARQHWADAGRALWVALGVAAAGWLIARVRVGPRATACAAVALAFAVAVVALHGRRTLAGVRPDPWLEIQAWAAQNTPKDALFMTPPQQGGFRIHSGRSVVCEWRDGTQLYFNAAFTKDWWEKLTALRPALYDAAAGRELLSSKTLERMSDQEVVKLAKAYGATHVVLPESPNGPKRELFPRYSNGVWTVYEPVVLDEQDRFIKQVALPNIEKHRKSDVALTLTDAAGRPLPHTGTAGAATADVRMVRHAFHFGISLPFFQEPAGEAGPDYEPSLVTAKQLEAVKGVFNYSVIPYSAKWQRLEPVEGERRYEELDKYVDWCTKHGLAMEFHYLSGFTPTWVRYKTPAEQKEAWLRHCRATVARYQDRITYWQVMNDKYLSQWAAEAFAELRQKYPHLKLGISDCSKFYSPYTGQQAWNYLMDGADELAMLQKEGHKVDFFATHAHGPRGHWFDMRTVHDTLDEWAKFGVKIHASEMTLDPDLRFASTVRQSDAWTPELAAEFMERYYTVLFSHKDVASINYWDIGPSLVRGGSGRGGFASGGATGRAGLLDPTNNDQPRPLYHTLKRLITEQWTTRLTAPIPQDNRPIAFRGFHGDYEVTVRTPDGKRLKGTFSVRPDGPNAHQVKLSEDANSVAAGQ
jgi:GH35 family endo-1,4-beta-xylanase